MNYLEKNLSLLADKQPELVDKIRIVTDSGFVETFRAKNGMPSLKVHSVSLHSGYDPVKEAERQASSLEMLTGKNVLLKGFGLGYLAEALVKQGRTVIAAEAEPEVLRKAFEMRDFCDWLRKLTIFCGEEAENFSLFLKRHNIGTEIQIVDHSPSIKLNPGFYSEVEKALTDSPAEGTDPQTPRINLPHIAVSDKDSSTVSQNRSLRIFIPSPLYGGSLPVAGYCRNALEKLGHTVEYFDSTPYYPIFSSTENITANQDHQGKLKALFTMFVAQAALAKALEFKPDLVFGVAQSPFTQDSLADFKRMNIPVAFWFVEDYQVLPYWQTFAPLYDYFFTIQRGGEFQQLLDQKGVRNHYLPMAADPEIHKPLNLSEAENTEFGSDLSFMGAGYPNRRVFLQNLLNDDFKLWGTEWDMNSPLAGKLQRNGARIPADEYVKIFNASKININLHSWMESGIVDPRGDFVNPRTFEIAACGGFQLCDPRLELPNLFDIGREIITFDSVEDFHRKKDYYLQHPDERDRIAEAGRQRVLREHTYLHRMQEMLKITLGIDTAALPFTAAVSGTQNSEPGVNLDNRAGELMKTAGADSELQEVFQAFSPDEILDVDKIAGYIRDKEGVLNKTERVFLLMKEFADWGRQKNVI